MSEDLKDYRSILLLGVDARANQDVSKCRSDAMVVLTINKKTNKLALTSIMRDSFLYLDEGENYKVLDKLTHAHVYGGPVNTIRAINRNLDLNITGYMRVNWRTVADLADAFGGIEVNIKDYEIDEMNKYIKDTNRSLHGSTKMIKKAGKQTLNGVQTVTYCRIRKVGNGDKERTLRMRRVVKQLVKKATQMDLHKLSETADEVLPQIQTSLDPDSLMTILRGYREFEVNKSKTWPYKYAGLMIDNGSGHRLWYDVPITLESNVIKLHEKVFKQKNYEPSDTVKEINQQIMIKAGAR
ncbi:MAG: LCP family protein [Firmicutes bacterium]|nr:LCP family protein [Bacillota bacterium]